MKLYKKDGTVIEVTAPSLLDEVRHVKNRLAALNDASSIVEKELIEFVRRNALNLAQVVNEVARTRGVTTADATSIVLQVSAVATGNMRRMADEFQHNAIDALCAEHDAQEFRPFPTTEPVTPV